MIYCIPAYRNHVAAMKPIDRHRGVWEEFLALPPAEAGAILAMGRARAALRLDVHGNVEVAALWGVRSCAHGLTQVDAGWLLFGQNPTQGLRDMIRHFKGWLDKHPRSVYAEPFVQDKMHTHLLRLGGFVPASQDGVWVWHKPRSSP